MNFHACGQTDKGLHRENNEDRYCIDESLSLFMVADGMGGHAAGEIASQIAVDAVQDHLRRAYGDQQQFIGLNDTNLSEGANWIASAARIANQVICQASQKNVAWHGMGTTLDAAWYHGGKLVIAHVGDSRVYRIRNNDVVRLTDDHSVVEEQIKAGLISEADAEKQKVKNILTRALGRDPQVKVDVLETEIQDQDLILLCTDGLTSMLPDDILLSLIVTAAKPKTACKALIDEANRRGGKDNITAVLVACQEMRP